MAWALTGGLGLVFLAVGVMAVLGLRGGDDESAGELERTAEFGERPGTDQTFGDAELVVHRVLPEETTCGWRLADNRWVRHA